MLDELKIKDASLRTDLKDYCQKIVNTNKRDISLTRLKEIATAYSDGFQAYEDRIARSPPEMKPLASKSKQDQKIARLLDLWEKLFKE